MTDYSLKNLMDKLAKGQALSFDESFALSKVCSQFLSTEEKIGRDLIIRVLDKIGFIPTETRCIWNDLTLTAGLYPYCNIDGMTANELIKLEYHKSKNLENIFFNSEQMDLVLDLEESRSMVVSAPTSFGKSLLIEEVIASNRYNNIVIIQPTLALLDETRKKIKKYSNFYNMIVSTNQIPKERNIFLFTGERVCEYRLFPFIDFFVIDEFYKLSFKREESDRAIALNLALYKLLNYTKNFLMLGPHVSNITDEFKLKYNAKWIYTDFATVAVDVSDCYTEGVKAEEKEQKLFDLLDTIDEPTLIYCSSPDRANKLAYKYILYNSDIDNNSENDTIIEWIEHNIHSDWELIKLLSFNIGVHHGGLPRHIASAIVDQFNFGSIDKLFCTSTLIEGVNTSAKNVIFFDKKKGPIMIDYFDYKNIIGRSGRMMKHLIGSVYKFEKQPEENIEYIDIPIIEQNETAPVEMLIQIENKDLKESGAQKLYELKHLDSNLREIIKSNVGIPVEGQLKIIDEIEKDFANIYSLINWSQVPTYKQLEYVVDLCWRNLKGSNRGEGGAFSSKQLAYTSFNYYWKKSLKALIDEALKSDYLSGDVNRTQIIINATLQLSKHWFDYKLPKWLSVVTSLQAYVCEKRGVSAGSYVHFIQSIENHFLSTELTILTEYGVPVSAVSKLKNVLLGCISIEQMIAILRKVDLYGFGLVRYEVDSIVKLF